MKFLACFINQRALYNQALSVVMRRCCQWASAVLCVYSPPSHMVSHRNFVFGVNMYTCLQQTQVKFLVILCYGFKWQPFLYFQLICYPAHTDSHRDLILHVLMYPFFTYVHKSNNTTLTYFLKLRSIFSKFIYSLLL